MVHRQDPHYKKKVGLPGITLIGWFYRYIGITAARISFRTGKTHQMFSSTGHRANDKHLRRHAKDPLVCGFC